MEIKFCNNQEEWEEDQRKFGNFEFLQSWDWGEFQVGMGKRVLRLKFIENGETKGQIQGFEHRIPFLGKYLYLPRIQNPESRIQNLITELKKKNYIFVRLEPIGDNSKFKIQNSKFVHNRQPKQTLILDLTRSQEELLSAMHAKTRYNIHLAEKHGVEISMKKNLEVFWLLNLETTMRDEFKSHEKEYYKKMLELDMVYQITAYYRNKPIASNILIVYKSVAVYLHGASSADFRNLMAPYLLQWEGIKLSKSLGCQFYDFWGIAPRVYESDIKQHSCFNNFCWEVNHAWSGVTRFKVGFGGMVKEYSKAVDIIIKPWYYWLYKFVRKVRGYK